MSTDNYLSNQNRCCCRHFFPSSVLQKVGSSVSEEPVNNEDQFMTMMKAIGESFLQPDIALFKQNLAALENVNTKWRLYQKVIVVHISPSVCFLHA